MATRILIPTPLRVYTDKKDVVISEGKTIRELLDHLTTTYAPLRRHLYADDGSLRSFVNVYLNNDDIRYLQNENTEVKDSDTVSIIPSIAGGVH